MNDVYFKASLQNTLNPEVGTFNNVNNKEGTFTLEDGEYYLTNNTGNSYRVYYPTKDIYSVGFTIEFDINYNSNSGFKWLLLFNGDDSTYWHGFSLESSILRYVGNGLSNYDLITSTNTWLHVKCIFDYYFNQNAVHIYIDNVEVNNFIISNNYGIKYIDILGNSGGYVADAKIKNIIIYDSSKKHYLDTIGLTSLWSKIKSLFATKTELGSKANDSDVVHKSENETITGTKTFSSNIVGNLTGNADTATKATQDSDGNQINTTYSKNGHTHDDRYYTETEVNNLLNGKANDADVVHKSLDETIAGDKGFFGTVYGVTTNGLWFRHLDGTTSSNLDGDLYLNYHNYSRPIHVGNQGYMIYNNGANYSGTAQRAIQDSNGNQINTTYLPLAGGRMTGGDVYRTVDNSYLALGGATKYANGASLILRGKDNQDNAGFFHLNAYNGTIGSSLVGRPNGTLTWHGNNVSLEGHTHDDRYYTETEVNNLLNGKANTSGTYNSFNAGNGVDSSGGDWIRFKNGIQICYGKVSNNNNIKDGYSRYSYPVAFIESPKIVVTPDVDGKYFACAYTEGTSSWVLLSVGAYNGISFTSDPLAVNYIAIGKWK